MQHHNVNYFKCMRRLNTRQIEDELVNMGWESKQELDRIDYKHVFIKRPSTFAKWFGAKIKFVTIPSDSQYLDAAHSDIKGYQPFIVLFEKKMKKTWSKQQQNG